MKKHNTLAVVQTWLKALNNRNDEGVIQSSDPDIEIVGPRGSGYGRQLLQDWLNQAHVSLESLRTFARDDRVVVVQHVVWHAVETGDVIGEADVASQFRVKEGRVAQYARYDSLDKALEAARLNEADEIR
jgi:hypothetical protein